jgi:predicted secreted protein
MTATTALLGFGVRLVRNTTTDLGELIELSGPSLARDAVEASHALSTNRFREFISGLRDGGEVSATIALVPATAQSSPHQELMDDFNNNSAVAYRVIFPDANTYFTFSGLITALEHATPIDDRMTLAVTIKITGEPTLAALS